MRVAKSACKGVVLLFLVLTSASCPAGAGGTFKVYIINLSVATIDDVALKNQDTSMFEAVADTDIAPGTMMELNVSKAKFQSNSGSLLIHIAGGSHVGVNGVVMGPGPVVFYYKNVADTALIDYVLG